MARWHIPATLCTLLACVQPVLSQPFEDPRNGIRIDLEPGYRVVSEPMPGDTSLIVILGADEFHPFVPGARTPMCVIAHWQDPGYAGLSQAEIDARAPDWPAEVVRQMAGAASLEQVAPFQHQGMAGMEIVTRLTRSVTNEAFLVIFAMATPQGRASISCAAATETLADALPVYRAVRDGVTLPR